MRKLTTREASGLLRSLEGVSEKDHFGGDGFSANGQSHLIHEFRELCGLTPSRYLARRTEHFGHLPA